jgi:hypothetical protein
MTPGEGTPAAPATTQNISALHTVPPESARTCVGERADRDPEAS